MAFLSAFLKRHLPVFLYHWLIRAWNVFFPLVKSILKARSIFSRNNAALHFSNEWADINFQNWQKMFAALNFVGRPNLKYLEIGCFEGKSLLWMLKNVLTHPSSRAVVVDVFGPNYAFQFFANLAAAGELRRVEIQKGFSRQILRKLPLNCFDIIYVDGGHSMSDVFMDLGLSWDLLKVGGIAILDDYRIGENALPTDMHPKQVIDTFLLGFGGAVEVLADGNQVIFRKKAEIVGGNIIFDLGQFSYDWYRKQLIKNDSSIVNLDNDDIRVMDNFIKTVPLSYGLQPSSLPPDVTRVLQNHI